MVFFINKKLRKENAEKISDSTIGYLLNLARLNQKIYVDISLQDIKDTVAQQEGRFNYLSDQELLSAMDLHLEKSTNNKNYVVVQRKTDTYRFYLRNTQIQPLEYNDAKELLVSANPGADDQLFEQGVMSVINDYIKDRLAEGRKEIPIYISAIDATMQTKLIELYHANLSEKPTDLIKQTMENYAITADNCMNAKYDDDLLLLKFE